jgi:poly-gamma-glutamate synthesis protein (capsule biosynthesis protein)
MILAGDLVPGVKPARVALEGTVLCNLEGPVLTGARSAPLPKAGPALFSTNLPDSPAHFIFSLANNHLMDFGAPGLEATTAFLDGRGDRWLGAGNTEAEARRPLLVQDGSACVGILACCEAQFGCALPNRGGVAEIGPWVYETIRQLQAEADRVIVSVHVALELSPWPSPRQQALFRSFIDTGADLVHGHHAHVPQGWETYGGGLILYGLGNFLVDPAPWTLPNTRWSLVSEPDWSRRPVGLRVRTFAVTEEDGVITVSEEPPGTRDDYLQQCNTPLVNPTLLAALFQENAVRLFYYNYGPYLGFPLQLPPRPGWRLLLRQFLGKTPPRVVSRHDLLLWFHLFACQSHREAIAEALGVLGGELPDLRTAETARLADVLMPWSVGVVPA